MKITRSVFEAFHKCQTKAWLVFNEVPFSNTTHKKWQNDWTAQYRKNTLKNTHRLQDWGSEPRSPTPVDLFSGDWRFLVDVPLTTEFPEHGLRIESMVEAIHKTESAADKSFEIVPTRFVPDNRLSSTDRLSAAFDAAIIEKAFGKKIPIANIVYGDNQQTTKVRTSKFAKQIQATLAETKSLLTAPSAPELKLNSHCAECEYGERCRQLAIGKEDLGLLAGMTEKERRKNHSKGIFTITQLSHTFRPRRSSKNRGNRRLRYHHAVKAMALRERKIHVIDSPPLAISGTPVYFDVEGLPDRSSYYLVGIRIQTSAQFTEHSFWASSTNEEKQIWKGFLETLETVPEPVLVHYGSYDKKFLDTMGDRYGLPANDSKAEKAIRNAINLVSVLYAHVYFPTYSNGLKEIAQWLGFKWSFDDSTGLNSMQWRLSWEDTKNEELKKRLITYNLEDCRALKMVVEKIFEINSRSTMRADPTIGDFSQKPANDRAAIVHETFQSLIKSAHYTEKKIKLNPATPPIQAKEAAKAGPKLAQGRKLSRCAGRIIRVPMKRTCQRHREQITKLKPSKKEARLTLLELAFTRTGIRKQSVTYVGRRARCTHCDGIYTPPSIKRLRNQIFGEGFDVWVAYLRVALRLSYRLIEKATKDFFGARIRTQSLENHFEQCSQAKAPAEDLLLTRLLKSPAIHVDETRLSILGNQQYVWVLNDKSHVVFRLTPTRETDFLRQLLKGYQGVLVSDFYGGYDALPFRQQKCWVHLIRDLNDDLWKNPFDQEYESFVTSVQELIKPIFEDVHKFGLKRKHLKTHKKSVKYFYDRNIRISKSANELVAKYQGRFIRFENSIFSFLSENDIPWNNNAAERALRHVAVQRKISGAFTTRGAQDYLRLLSIAQSCRFQDKSFLRFLQSDKYDVDKFKDKK